MKYWDNGSTTVVYLNGLFKTPAPLERHFMMKIKYKCIKESSKHSKHYRPYSIEQYALLVQS